MAACFREGNVLQITCDKCKVEAPPAPEIMKGFGLNNMGWHCSGGNHLCPECAPKAETA